MGLAGSARLVNNPDLLRSANPVGVCRPGGSIGRSFRKPAVSGNAGKVQGVDARCQRHPAGANGLAVVSQRSRLPGRPRTRQTVRDGAALEYPHILGGTRDLGNRLQRRLSGPAGLLVATRRLAGNLSPGDSIV